MPTWFRARPAFDTRADAGAAAEAAAEAWLRTRGMRCIARNFRCRGGELDRVMLDGEVLVFVEVRLRTRSDFGGAAASINTAKQRRLTHAAQVFLQQHTQHGQRACRFDVMLAGAGEDWTWLRNAIA